MAALAWPAQGTTFAIAEVANNNTFSLINQIVSISNIGGETVTQAKTTNLSSLVHTYRGTIPDPSEIQFSLNWDPTDAVHLFIRDLADTPANGPNQWKATYNVTNGSSDVFSGNVAEFNGPTADDVEANLTAEFTVKRSGAATRLPA